MADLIFFSTPWLLAAPLSVFVLSAVCAVSGSKFLRVLNVILHIAVICVLINVGGSLYDVFATMLVSCLGFLTFGKKDFESIKKDGEVDEE